MFQRPAQNICLYFFSVKCTRYTLNYLIIYKSKSYRQYSSKNMYFIYIINKVNCVINLKTIGILVDINIPYISLC